MKVPSRSVEHSRKSSMGCRLSSDFLFLFLYNFISFIVCGDRGACVLDLSFSLVCSPAVS
jgi:hypothetical protein